MILIPMEELSGYWGMSSALSKSCHCLAGAGLWSYREVSLLVQSVAWDNLEEKVLKIGLNIQIHVGRLTGSIACGRGRKRACADAPVLDENRGLGKQCQWPVFQSED